MRPQPAVAIFGGQEQAQAAQTAGDDVGAVVAEDRSLLRRHAPRWSLRCAAPSSTSLPVCSAPLITRIAVAASASGYSV